MDTNLRQVATSLTRFPPSGVRRASVNSFGYGGTNAHAILDGWDRRETISHCNSNEVQDGVDCDELSKSSIKANVASYQTDRARAFVFTHRTKTGVIRVAQDVKDWMEGRPRTAELNLLDDLANTLGSHRTRFGWRLDVTAASREELLDALSPQHLEPRRALNDPRIGFIFTGQGAQWYAMGVELIDRYEAFRSILVSADTHFKGLGASWSLLGGFCPEIFSLLIAYCMQTNSSGPQGHPASILQQLANRCVQHYK